MSQKRWQPGYQREIIQKFEAERWQKSAVSAQNGIPCQSSDTTWFLHLLTAKRWTCALLKRFFKEKPSFWQTYPKVKFTVSSYFYLKKKLLVLCVGLLYLKNCSDKARRVVHLSPCCRFHASLCTIQSKKLYGNIYFLVIGYTCCAWRWCHNASSYHRFSSD